MVQVDLDQLVNEHMDRCPIFVLCKNCAIHITYFLYMNKYDKHFWKVYFEDLENDVKDDLEFSNGNIFCVCKRLMGESFDENIVLIKKSARVIDY